jgi:parallel beta-helix repeat protein
MDNSEAGIAYFDEAGGVAQGNECSGNLYGIYVEATADPELVDNDCHDNSKADIVDERLWECRLASFMLSTRRS